MTLNRVKLGRAVTFMKHIASVVSLIFLAKTFHVPGIKFAEFCIAGRKWVSEEYLQKNLPIFFFYPIYHYLMKRFQELITKEPDNFIKILISIVFD